MAGVGRSPPGRAGTPKGKAQGADATSQQEAKAMPTETLILKEMRGIRAMVGGMEGMEGRLGTCVTDLKKKVEESSDSTVRAIGALEDRVKKNEKELGPTIDRVLDDRIKGGALEATIDRALTKRMGQMPKGACSAGLEKADRYHICRRSLRMWPLDAKDLHSSLGNFLLGKLGLSQEDVNGMGKIKYKKCHSMTASRIKN